MIQTKNKSSEKNINIKNYYAETKLLAEKKILNLNGCILRTNFFGYNKNRK